MEAIIDGARIEDLHEKILQRIDKQSTMTRELGDVAYAKKIVATLTVEGSI